MTDAEHLIILQEQLADHYRQHALDAARPTDDMRQMWHIMSIIQTDNTDLWAHVKLLQELNVDLANRMDTLSARLLATENRIKEALPWEDPQS